jgi:hypothetical protein
MVVHAYKIPDTWEAEVGRLKVQVHPGKKCETLSEKQTKSKGSRGMAQVVESLPNKCEALGSVPSTEKKKKSQGFSFSFKTFGRD